MATFEPTQAEKDAATYLDWDDAELGKFCKNVALTLDRLKDDAEGLHKVTAASCAMMLVRSCVDINASTLSLKLDGYTHKNEPGGDWTITVKRNRKKAAPR